MAYIKLELDHPIGDGESLTFKAPCDCTEATSGVKIYYPTITDEDSTTTSQIFKFRDAHGNNITTLGNLFLSGAYVKIIADTTNNYAYIQNADTNQYLETQLSSKAPAYTYGTTDLTAGTSALETGKLYFVYE